MSDSKHERDGRAESVRALMLIRESCADVDAWQVWAANGDLVEAYPNELLDHITDLTQRAEAAEARRNVWKDMLDSADCSAREGLGLLHCRLDAKCTVCSLRAECEALRKDAARLDYLDTVRGPFSRRPMREVIGSEWWFCFMHPATHTPTIREALDAAMAVQPTTGEGV